VQFVLLHDGQPAGTVDGPPVSQLPLPPAGRPHCISMFGPVVKVAVEGFDVNDLTSESHQRRVAALLSHFVAVGMLTQADRVTLERAQLIQQSVCALFFRSPDACASVFERLSKNKINYKLTRVVRLPAVAPAAAAARTSSSSSPSPSRSAASPCPPSSSQKVAAETTSETPRSANVIPAAASSSPRSATPASVAQQAASNTDAVAPALPLDGIAADNLPWRCTLDLLPGLVFADAKTTPAQATLQTIDAHTADLSVLRRRLELN
jgi:hypothetical protein